VKRVICGALVALLSASLVHPVLAASSEVGVVLMHGKWGSPQSMLPLARELESRSYLVSNAEMAWSGRRLYDVDYPAALKEIEQQVRQLRANGAKRVVVAGQSLGSNAAVAYASSGFDLDGLVILSPGHFPEGGWGNGCVPASSEQEAWSQRTEVRIPNPSMTSIRANRGQSKLQPAHTFPISTRTASARSPRTSKNSQRRCPCF
jgi:dienelactone hydrolase